MLFLLGYIFSAGRPPVFRESAQRAGPENWRQNARTIGIRLLKPYVQLHLTTEKKGKRFFFLSLHLKTQK
jgi:hypothetical protein